MSWKEEISDAVRINDISKVELLLVRHQKELKAITMWDETAAPVHEAVLLKRDLILKQMLEAGANVNAQKMRDLMTPLHCALLMHNFSTIKLLSRYGADENISK